MHESERRTNWVGIGLLCVLLCLLIAHCASIVILDGKLQPRLSAIKAGGKPMSFADYANIRIPPYENAATIYDQAFQLVDGPDASTDLGTLGKFLQTSERKADPKLWDQARQILPKYGKAISLVEQATLRPRCWFDTNWQAGAGTVFPHYSKLRKLSQLLAADAILKARDGKQDEALHSVYLGVKMANAAKDEPTMIGFLVRAAQMKMSTRSLRAVLEYGDISETQAARIYRTLAEADLGPSFVKAMEGERAMGLWAFDEARRNPAMLRSFTSSSGNGQNSPGWQVLGYAWRPVLNKDEMYFLDYWDRYLKRVDLPWRVVQAQPGQSDPEPEFPRYAILSNVVCPLFGRARLARDELIAETAGAQIVLALKVYNGRYGSYPSSLKELRSRVGWKILPDPFSGKDFVYRQEKHGFVLYSLGENLLDDGARTFPKSAASTQSSRYTDQDGQPTLDITWRMSR